MPRRKDAVHRYSMLTGCNSESNANVTAIGESFANSRGNRERFGGRIVGAFGAVDADTANKPPGMVDTKVLPLSAMEDYRVMIEEL